MLALVRVICLRLIVVFLQVKVRPNWLEEKERYSEMGLDFKDGNA